MKYTQKIKNKKIKNKIDWHNQILGKLFPYERIIVSGKVYSENSKK